MMLSRREGAGIASRAIGTMLLSGIYMIDGELGMSDTNRLFYLRIALIVFGLIFIFGIYPLSIVWPSGWIRGHGHSHYLLMIIGIYATLGVFLLS